MPPPSRPPRRASSVSRVLEIAVELRIEAPPAVVFRFFRMLDHLRFISPRYRQEWCTRAGVVVGPGTEAEVRIQQGSHGITVRFRNVLFEPDRLIEDEFVSFPLRGARHRQILEPEDGGLRTLVRSVSRWEPPWYLRKLVERKELQQRQFFEERLANAMRLIEAVHALRGAESFGQGIAADAAAVGAVAVVREPGGRA